MAWMYRIPIVLHSSDSVPSLSDKLIGRIAQKICTGFPKNRWPKAFQKKIIVTGNPVRAMIHTGSKAAAQRITGFSGRRPTLMIIGGSQGSLTINHAVERHFEELLGMADIMHLTGSGKGIEKKHARYWSAPYVTGDLPHLYAAADVVLTRAGAGVLAELAALKKTAVIMPLEGVAHDHQTENAHMLEQAGAAEVLLEAHIEHLPSVIHHLLTSPKRREMLGSALSDFFPSGAAERIATTVLDVLRQTSLQSHSVLPPLS
jgi:UDP-N-acetylglucosamine--N-acetylmuramyl-(pentapeptide) pyrophosphoryl-undecaprenol N-acetylglucosamine transferase